MIIVLHSDVQPEYSITLIVSDPPNFTVQPPTAYSDEPPPEYSDEPPPEYPYESSSNSSDEPPPNYSDLPPPNFSDEPLPNYSDLPLPNFSDEPPPNYSDLPSPNFFYEPPAYFSDEPPPSHSDEPPPSYYDEPPPEYPYESSANFSDEQPPNYSDLPQPTLSNESSSISSDEILQNSYEIPPNFSDEPLTIYSDEQPPNFFDELPPNFLDILDTGSDIFRDDCNELASRQSINADISAISTQEHIYNNITCRNEISIDSSPISRARLDTSRMGFPIIDIDTLADSEQNLNSSCTLELNTMYPGAGQEHAFPGETTSQTRNTQDRTVTSVSGSIDGNEVKFRCGSNLMCMVGVASLFCCFTGFIAMYYAIMKDKYLDKDETKKAKTAETNAIVLLIVTYVIFCGGICASIGIIIQSKYLALLPILLFLLIFCIISIWCGYCKR